jgi:hypothetical protein
MIRKGMGGDQCATSYFDPFVSTMRPSCCCLPGIPGVSLFPQSRCFYVLSNLGPMAEALLWLNQLSRLPTHENPEFLQGVSDHLQGGGVLISRRNAHLYQRLTKVLPGLAQQGQTGFLAGIANANESACRTKLPATGQSWYFCLMEDGTSPIGEEASMSFDHYFYVLFGTRLSRCGFPPRLEAQNPISTTSTNMTTAIRLAFVSPSWPEPTATGWELPVCSRPPSCLLALCYRSQPPTLRRNSPIPSCEYAEAN